MTEYHTKTCIKFVERTNEADYISITGQYGGCFSAVGRIRGAQQVNLQVPGCVTMKGTVIHELMHVLGFFHEHSRYDRDDYIDINFNNIQFGNFLNFILHLLPIILFYNN